MLVELALRLPLLAAIAWSLVPRRGCSVSVQWLRWFGAAAAIAVAVQADPIGLGLARVDGTLLGSACAVAPPR